MSFEYQFQKKISLYPLLAIAFAMPLFPSFLPILIIIWFTTWFIDEPMGNKVDRIANNKFIWIFIAFYLMHIIAMLYTNNKPVGWFDLEVKTSIWLLPILFAGASRLIHEKLNQIFIAFLIGVIIATIGCFIMYFTTYTERVFYLISYTRLSYFLHPSYFSLYIDFCIGFLLFKLINSTHNTSIISKVGLLVLIAYLLFFTYMLSSKAGIIGAAIAITLPFIIYIFKQKKLIYYAALIIGIICTGLIIVTNYRFKKLLQTQKIANETTVTNETSAIRIYIWKAAIDVIKESPITGVGTGDIKDKLTTKYEENNIKHAVIDKLNVHNQFIETLIGQGIIGLILLLSIFIWGIKTALSQQDYLMLLFFILCILNFLFESMLNTQAGVIFFAFMSGLFFIRLKKTEYLF